MAASDQSKVVNDNSNNRETISRGIRYLGSFPKDTVPYSYYLILFSQAFHNTLEGVNLGSNALGNKGVECLKEGLLSSRSIARLVMASCNITNEGAVVMAEIVGDHTTLIHLDLRENNIRFLEFLVFLFLLVLLSCC